MNEDDVRLSGDDELPEASLVRPYVESLGESASPKVAPSATPASTLPAAEAPTARLPRISLTTRKHGARDRAPLAAGVDVDGEQLPPAPTRARVAIAAGIAVAAMVAAYAIWSPGGGSSRAPVAAIAPSVLMPSASPSPSSAAPAPSRTTASSGAQPPRTPSPSARSSRSTAPIFDPSSPRPSDSAVNLAAGRSVTDTGHNGDHVAANAVDGNPSTYWESVSGDFPQSITVDLGASMTVSRLVLRLPPSPSWNKRTQLLSIRSSHNRGKFHTVVSKATLTFDPDAGNQAAITFSGTDCRYVRLTFMSNTGSPAGQASEIELFSS